MPAILEVAAKTWFLCFKVNTPFKANQLFLTLILGSPFSLCWQGRYVQCVTVVSQPLTSPASFQQGRPDNRAESWSTQAQWFITPPSSLQGGEQGGGKPVSFSRRGPIEDSKAEPSRCFLLTTMRACTPWAPQGMVTPGMRRGGLWITELGWPTFPGTPRSDSPAVSRTVSQDAEWYSVFTTLPESTRYFGRACGLVA